MVSPERQPGTGRHRRSYPRLIRLFVAFALVVTSAIAAGGIAAAQAVVATIPVGSGPFGMGVNPSTGRIYVTNGFGNTVSVIDGKAGSPTNDQVVATIPVGHEPFDVGVNPSTNRIYVANNLNNAVWVVDGTSNAVVAKVTVGTGPFGVGVNPSTNRVYVANFSSGTVSVIDGTPGSSTENQVIATVPVGSNPIGVGVNPATNRVYVANTAFGASSVSVIDGTRGSPTENHVVATVSVGSNAFGVAVNAKTNRVYVANSNLFGSNGSVSVIDGATNGVVATVSVGNVPKFLDVNPSTNNVYVANYGTGNVSVIDGATNTVSATIPVGSGPFGVGVDTVSNRVYIANHLANTVSVIQDAPSTTTASTTTTVSNATAQYSDAVALSATVSPRSLNGQTLTGSVAFAINGASAGSAMVNASGVASVTVPSVLLAAGSYPITATFTSTNPAFADSHGTGTLTVTREDATVTSLSSNPSSVKVNAAGGTAGPITLGAAIAEVPDNTPGDISKAVPVNFKLIPVGPGTTYTCAAPSGTVSGKTLTVSCTFASVSVNDYEIQIDVGGGYYQGSADPTVLVYDPAAGFVTGGGTIVHNGARANVTFDAKYVQGNQPQGSLLYVEHRPTGDLVLKSTGVLGMALVGGKIAYVEGTASLNGSGTYTFLMTAVDNGTPGKSDQFGLQVKDANGSTVASVTFAPTTLTGGNLVAHK